MILVWIVLGILIGPIAAFLLLLALGICWASAVTDAASNEDED